MGAVITDGDGPRFAACEGWGVLPDGWRLVEVAGVATDSRDRVFVFNRGDHPIIIFDREGRFLGTWGEQLFVRPHGIMIGPDDAVYCTDDLDHTVKKFSPEGKLLLTLGTSGRASDTGAASQDFRTIRHAGPPFHYPTNLALAADGSMYISDGYGNARIHKFSHDGVHLYSWGEPGRGPGEFRLPHGIAVAHGWHGRRGRPREQPPSVLQPRWPIPEGVDRHRAAVPGRRRCRRPCLCGGAGLPGGDVAGYHRTQPGGDRGPGQRLRHRRPAPVSLGRRGESLRPGDFYAPHDLCLDSRGDLYVGEVTWSAGGDQGVVPPDCHSLQKFARLG